MGRAKYQVLVIPYRKSDHDTLYCVFKRSDMDECWQFIAGGGEDEDQTHKVKSPGKMSSFSSKLKTKSSAKHLLSAIL